MEKRLLNLRESRDVLQQQRRRIREENLAKNASRISKPISLFQETRATSKNTGVIRILNRVVAKLTKRH